MPVSRAERILASSAHAVSPSTTSSPSTKTTTYVCSSAVESRMACMTRTLPIGARMHYIKPMPERREVHHARVLVVRWQAHAGWSSHAPGDPPSMVDATPRTAQWDASAVLSTLADAVSGGELNELLSPATRRQDSSIPYPLERRRGLVLGKRTPP